MTLPKLVPFISTASLIMCGCQTTVGDAIPMTAPPPNPPGGNPDTLVMNSNRSDEGTDSRVVVLVHGIFNTADRFRKMRADLEANGFTVFAPSLAPNNAWHGLPDLAEKLKAEIDANLGPEAPFALVGFSMGGLVSRYYLQELGGHARCQSFVVISSPLRGTLTGYAYVGDGAKQMRFNSEFLTALDAPDSLARLDRIPLYAYHTPLDLMIIPAESSAWHLATNRTFWVAAHPLMLWDDAVIAALVEDLETSLPTSSAGSPQVVANEPPGAPDS
ncbi:MAG: esterase/lipase family protein [Opitutales bacterium]